MPGQQIEDQKKKMKEQLMSSKPKEGRRKRKRNRIHYQNPTVTRKLIMVMVVKAKRSLMKNLPRSLVLS